MYSTASNRKKYEESTVFHQQEERKIIMTDDDNENQEDGERLDAIMMTVDALYLPAYENDHTRTRKRPKLPSHVHSPQ